MKFIHTSDWHLGYAQYNLEARFNDFFRAAVYTVDKIIELNPDFVIHTGDIFHHSKPTPGAIRHAVFILQKLKKAGIPFYLIRGNHDAKTSRELAYGGTSLKLLSELKLIEYIDDKTILLDELNVAIAGIGHYFGTLAERKVKEVLSNSKIPSNYFKILALHNFIQGQLDKVSETVSIGLIDSLNLDYVAGGHYHIPWVRDNVNIWVPGSSEATSANDWRRDDVLFNSVSVYSSFYEIEAVNKSGKWEKTVRTHKIPIRPKIFLKVESYAETASEVKKELIDEIQEKMVKLHDYFQTEHEDFLVKYKKYKDILHKPVVRIHLSTDMRREEMDLFQPSDIQTDLDLLKLEIIINQEEDEFYIPTETISTLHIDQIIKELSIEMGGEEIYPLVQKVIQEFDNRPVSRDLNDEEIDRFIGFVETGVSNETHAINGKSMDKAELNKNLEETSKDRSNPKKRETSTQNESSTITIKSSLEDWLK